MPSRSVATQDFKKLIKQETPLLKRSVGNLYRYGLSRSDITRLVREAMDDASGA